MKSSPTKKRLPTSKHHTVFSKGYPCNRFLCTYENPPQVAPGTYICRAIYAGKPCTGSYWISQEDAEEYDNICFERQEEQEQAQEYERRVEHARQLRRRKDEEHLERWRGERSAYQCALSANESYSSSVQDQELLASQLEWMRSRIAELDEMIVGLEQLDRKEIRRSASDVSLSSYVIVEHATGLVA